MPWAAEMGLLIGWIGRVLLILFVVRLIVSLFRSGASQPTGRASGPNRGPNPSRGSGRKEKTVAKLVRDPQCGTYVSETSAIRMSHGGETLHFCSERCRDEYRASPRANAS